MLSLNKTKSREELAGWLNGHEGVLSWKMDGLTVVLTYSHGELIKAVTRGNGEIGEVITPNAKAFKNVPLHIAYDGDLVIRGEAIIRYSDFTKINNSIPDADARYKNPRNLCSGSVRQLDSRITSERSVYLYAFALISAANGTSVKGLSFTSADLETTNSRLAQFDMLEALGFTVVEHKQTDEHSIVSDIGTFEEKIAVNDFPSDGLVLIYDDIEYGRSLGRTAKFPRDGIAFKWADETAETTLREIEWSPSRTGLINPVAIFDPVELEGTTVSRASLHNISIMRDMYIGIGDHVTVYKANMIIPQIAENLTRSGDYREIDTIFSLDENGSSVQTDKLNSAYIVARRCPVCGKPTYIHSENDVYTLYCENPDCAAKQIKLFAHMASRDALNIDGISEATVEKLIDAGLITRLVDLFRLSEHKDAIAELEGFGMRSAENLILAADNARHTTLSRVLFSLGISNIGLAGARLISRFVNSDPERVITLTEEELTSIEGIGSVLAQSFTGFFKDPDNLELYRDLLAELTLEPEVTVNTESNIVGKTFVVTGSVYKFANRNDLKAYIESQGGKVTGSVTKNTDYLINNDITSGSSKNKTAKELGIEIITEDTFIEMFGSNL